MIATKRLSLGQVKNVDKDFIINYLACGKHATYLPLERAYTREEALKWFNGRLTHWLQHNFGTFLVQLRQQKVAIGYCGIEYVRDTQYIDIRYGITRQFWGNGYAYEAALAVLKNGFIKHGFEKLHGAAVLKNLASIRLLEKLGMTEDKEFDVYGDGIAHLSVNKEKYTESTTEQIHKQGLA
jgi:ribosomal-protein-alanine N-acetyltransferase